MFKRTHYLFLVMFLVCLGLNAHAVSHNIELSADEKAIFGYFHAVGGVTDYDFWITSDGSYDYIPEANREKYLYAETLKRGQAFSTYDPDRDFIELSSEVVVKLSEDSDSSGGHIVFEFFESNGDDSYIPTFDYKYGDDSISLIVNQLAFFANMALDERQAASMSEKVPYLGEYFKADLSIVVKPSDQSSRKPIEKDTGRQWIMIGDIAYIKCEEREGGKLLWDYTAPWYQDIKDKQKLSEKEKYPHPYDIFKD